MVRPGAMAAQHFAVVLWVLVCVQAFIRVEWSAACGCCCIIIQFLSCFLSMWRLCVQLSCLHDVFHLCMQPIRAAAKVPFTGPALSTTAAACER